MNVRPNADGVNQPVRRDLRKVSRQHRYDAVRPASNVIPVKTFIDEALNNSRGQAVVAGGGVNGPDRRAVAFVTHDRIGSADRIPVGRAADDERTLGWFRGGHRQQQRRQPSPDSDNHRCDADPSHVAIFEQTRPEINRRRRRFPFRWGPSRSLLPPRRASGRV